MSTTQDTAAQAAETTATDPAQPAKGNASAGRTRKASSRQRGAKTGDPKADRKVNAEGTEPTEPQAGPEAKADPKARELVALLTSGDFELHAKGCQDIARTKAEGKVQNEFPVTAATMREAVWEVYADQIEESSGPGLTYPDTEAGITGYLDHVAFLPCCKLPKGRAPAKAKAKAASTRKAAAPSGKRAEQIAALAHMAPAGYVVLWPHASHSLLKATAEAPEGSSPWLTLCNAHGTTTPAKAARDGEVKGTKAERQSWCSKCKSAATKAAKAEAAKADTQADEAQAGAAEATASK